MSFLDWFRKPSQPPPFTETLLKLMCPFCLTENSVGSRFAYPVNCSQCKKEMPALYVEKHKALPPSAVQVFGWSKHGKTVFLSAVTLMLERMSAVWPFYTSMPATDLCRRYVEEVRGYDLNGNLPAKTPHGTEDCYVMLLEDMERWKSKALVMRDCAGEIFDNMTVPKDQAPFLLKAPVTFMLISVPDLAKSDGRRMDMLMANYLNTLTVHQAFQGTDRKLIVVLTKADLIEDLPPNLRRYLLNDPIWSACRSSNGDKRIVLEQEGLRDYLSGMWKASDAVKEWLQCTNDGRMFIRHAERRNIETRFCLVSATGTDPDENNRLSVAWEPRRVLDPYFWAFEMESPDYIYGPARNVVDLEANASGGSDLTLPSYFSLKNIDQEWAIYIRRYLQLSAVEQQKALSELTEEQRTYVRERIKEIGDMGVKI